MTDVLFVVEILLYVSAIGLFVLGSGLMAVGSRTLLKEVTIPIYTIGLFLFAMTNGGHGSDFVLPRRVRVPTLVVVNVLFLVAAVLQLRANAKQSDSGPTHPKAESYEGGGQSYPWDEE